MLTTDEISELMKTIESLRKQMIISGLTEGLSSKNTIAISQRLDEHIAKYQSIHFFKT